MTATGQNFTMYQGDDAELTIINYDENDSPLNITSCVFNCVVYKRYPENIVLTKTTSSGITFVDALNGVMLLTLVPADTINLLGEYNYEIEMTDTNNKVSTTTVGVINILKSKA